MGKEPKEPKPQKFAKETQGLQLLYRTIGEVIALRSADQAKKLVIDGDLSIPFPEDLKRRIVERIKTKLSKAAALIQELQRDGRMD